MESFDLGNRTVRLYTVTVGGLVRFPFPFAFRSILVLYSACLHRLAQGSTVSSTNNCISQHSGKTAVMRRHLNKDERGGKCSHGAATCRNLSVFAVRASAAPIFGLFWTKQTFA